MDEQLSDLTALGTTPVAGDLFYVVDVSDTTDGVAGTSKKIDFDTLTGTFALNGANSDITSLSGLTTPLSVGQGGTGATSFTSGNVLVGAGTSAVTTVATTGSGNIVKATSATLTTPTIASATLSSPTMTTPTLGVATATSINGLTITASTGGLTVANGKTFSILSTITLVGTDSNSYTFPDSTQTIAGLTSTQTMTNKRITKRTVTVTQSATPTINTDNTDVAYITGLAQAITSMTSNLSGTPVANDGLIVSITDNGTGRAITWGTSFESSGNVTLPTTTVANVRLDVGFLWNVATSKWRCVGVA